jgi:hypothetical protein
MGWKEDRRAAYSEKLKDPRWQQARLRVFERDGWACQNCKRKDKTLNVHHWWYEQGHEPWEYPMECFVTLCEHCHELETKERGYYEQCLIKMLRKRRLLTYQIFDLALIASATSDNTKLLLAFSHLSFAKGCEGDIHKLVESFRNEPDFERARDEAVSKIDDVFGG